MNTTSSQAVSLVREAPADVQAIDKELALDGLIKSFGGTIAVNDVSLRVPVGSLTVLLGPSGCGKSTLLRLIAGFETPDAGTISRGAHAIDKLPPAKRDISMVFQSYALFPHLSVADNILFGLQVRRQPKEKQAERLAYVSEMMGLSKLLERKPSELSGGQQQRVALARAVVSERPICLMNEPLSNLDAKLRNEMRREIRGLQQKLGLTMIYVTHDQVEAITMADQIVLMNNGRIEQVGTPDAIYENPETTFCAHFIGTPPMNLIPAADLNQALLNNNNPPLPLDIVVGVRPEKISMGAHIASITKTPTNNRSIAAKIVATEYLGADHLLSCMIGSAEIIVRVPAGTAVPSDGQVLLHWDASDEHHFHQKTGRRSVDIPLDRAVNS